MVVLIVPTGRVPSTFVAYNDVQNQKERILPFDEFNVQLGWEQRRRCTRSSGGGIYILKCNVESSLVPEGEAEQKFHEYLDIYCLSPIDYERNQYKQLIVSDITYTVILDNGEEHNVRFDKRDETWAEHVEEELEALFDITDETEPEVKADRELKMKKATEKAVDQLCQELEENIRKYGDRKRGPPVSCIVKIYPRNFPAQTKSKLSSKSFDFFPNKQVVSMTGSVWTSLASSLVFDTQQGIDSPFGKLCEALLVEFLDNTGCIGCIPRGILSIVGLSRIAQYFGQDLLKMYAFSREPFENFLKDVVVSLKKKIRIKGKGRLPDNMNDFILNYSFAAEEDALPRENFPTHLHLIGDQLEVSFNNSLALVSIKAVTLTKYISPEATVLIIVELLQNPNPHTGIEIPAGTREGEEEKKENSPIRVDCFKQSLLKAPDRTLSPEGKIRAKISLPDHEITYAVARECIQKSIKTICLKKEKKSPHKVAMTSENVMIGEFIDGTHSHSVLIDGKAGTITDPVESFGTVERSRKGLEQLGIAQFHTVTTVKRDIELTGEKRSTLQQDLKLPFIIGSAKNWKVED